MRPTLFVPRDLWGAGPRGATPESHPIGATKGVTLHWEGPAMGPFPHSACPSKVRSIQDFHVDTRKWADIAYNALVCPHGYVFEGRGVNVKSAANGDTISNDDWYAVCYLSGKGDPFTRAAKKAFVDAVLWLREEGHAGPVVNGHRDHKPTECPGDDIYQWLQVTDFRRPSYGRKVDHAIEDLQTAKGGRRRRRRINRVLDFLRSTLTPR